MSLLRHLEQQIHTLQLGAVATDEGKGRGDPSIPTPDLTMSITGMLAVP